MTRTPDEIKKGLETLAGSLGCKYDCPYEDECRECVGCPLSTDALALIQQLEAERDVLKDALGLMVYQYCVRSTTLDHHFMCAGETAFRVLGLEQYGDVKKLEDWLFPELPKEE